MLNLSQAIDIINNRRNQAELQALLNLNTLRQDNLFQKLDTATRVLSFEIARMDCQNKDIDALKYDLHEKEQALRHRLYELGYSTCDIEPQYFCTKCNDTGFIKGIPCRCLTNLLYKNTNSNYIGPINDITSFDKVDINYYDVAHKAGYKNIFTQLEKYTKLFPSVIPFLLLIGDTGTGKTYMASIINNILEEKGFSTLYLNACDLNDLFLKYHLADISNKESIFFPLINCDLLIIDDLGSENIFNNVTVPYLYKLIINRQRKNTIITTNLDNSGIDARYNRRISSRLMDKQLTANVHINGIDLRLKR